MRRIRIIKDPYTAGRLADKKKHHVNPYPVGSVDYFLYEEGYSESKEPEHQEKGGEG